MKLAQLTLKNCGGVPDGIYRFADADGRPFSVVVMLGPPRCGLTTLLTAIVVAKEAIYADGSPRGRSELLRRGADAGFIEATWHLDEQECQQLAFDRPTWTHRIPLGAELPDPPNAKVVGLFQARRVDLELFAEDRMIPPPCGSAPSTREELVMRSASDPRKYAGLRHALLASQEHDARAIMDKVVSEGLVTAHDRPDSLAPAREALARFLPELRLTRARAVGHEAHLVFERSDGSTFELDELSASEKQAALLVLTRFRFGLGRAVILIDQPELHQHPAMHVAYAAEVARLWRGTQVIMATGSESVASAFSPEQRLRLGGAQ